MPPPREAESLILWCRTLSAPDDSASAALSSALRAIRGELLARIGGSAVFRFELPELHAALEAAILTLRQPEVELAVGVAIGEGDAAIDRAQYLGAYAPPRALLVDPSAISALDDAFLLAPPISPPPESPAALLIDTNAPIERERRAAIARLTSPKLPPAFRPIFRSIDEASRREGGALILLRGGANSGVDRLLQAFASHLRPASTLELNSAPLALEPLGGLRLALGRAALSSEKRAALGPLIVEGPASLSEIAGALKRALKPSDDEPPGLIFIDPLGGADPESERLLIESLSGTRALLIARVPSDREPPTNLYGRAVDLTLEMPLLGEADALTFAAAILGVPENDPAALHLLSARGGGLGTPLGDLLETARAAILRGEILYGEEEGAAGQFTLRAPTIGAEPEPPFRLAIRRVESLESSPLRLLEIACMIAPGTEDATIVRAAILDELSQEEIDSAITQLRLEAFLHPNELRPSSETIRAATLRVMAQSRRAELHRLIAEALAGDDEGPLAAITRATHLRAGGQSKEAARLLLIAAESAIALDSDAALNRLLAKAIEWDPGDATRQRAHQLARGKQHAQDRTRALIEALSRDQLGRAEGIIDAAITDGLDLEIAASLRALLQMRRGAPLAAQRQLEGRVLETPRARWALAFTKLFIDTDRAIDDFLILLRDARISGSSDDEEAALLGLALTLEAQGERSARLTQRLKDSRIASSKSR